MKDEIKEIKIPENVLNALGALTNGALNYYKATETVKVRHNTILDYIINLQEKYDKALTDLVHESHTRIKLERKITNLQERKITKEDVDKYFEENMCVSFDKFIENWNAQKEWANYYKKEYEKEHYLVDKLTRQLTDEYKNTEYQCKQKEDYKSRNEKAIEFMKENCDIISLNNGWIIRSELTTTGLGKLFKILNGDDKEC